MEGELFPESVGASELPPVSLTPEQEELCGRLDDLHNQQGLKVLPSDMFRSAVFAARTECRSNPDWISQAAHSLREILYPFLRHRRAVLKQYGSVLIDKKIDDEIGRAYGNLSDLAHHRSESRGVDYSRFTLTDFEKLLAGFERIMHRALTRQVDIHKTLDEVLTAGPLAVADAGIGGLAMSRKIPEQIDTDGLRKLIQENEDARQYFYAQADERWLDWLWKNGFLDTIKDKAKDPIHYSYRTPEINYLVQIAGKAPNEVADILLEVPISKENLNLEVIDRFLAICSTLPADQLSRLVKKIQDEHWVALINRLGFGYEEMLTTLSGAEDYASLFVLANALLEVRTREEAGEASRYGFSDNPFFLERLSHTKVFDFLAKVPDEHASEALALAVGVLGKVISLETETKPGRTFPIADSYDLMSVDFFDIELAHEDPPSGADNVRQLAAVTAILARRLIFERCSDLAFVRDLYTRTFDTLPQSRATWRLRLFALSLCPAAFQELLDRSFFRVFAVESYNDILSGAEYLKVLRKGFPVLPEERKRAYVWQVLERFSEAKRDEDAESLLRNGSYILSMIEPHLTGEERIRVERAGFKISAAFQPTPSIGPVQSGEVQPRGPITPEEFETMAVGDIAKKLRAEWTPKNLAKQDTAKDFLNPINAEGVGDLLKKDVAKRLKEYVAAAGLFFEREVLDQHYTYSFLRGIQEAIKEHPKIARETDWEGVLDLVENIRKAGEASAFDRNKRDRVSSFAWLVGWDAVHVALTDLLQGLLTEKDGRIPIDLEQYRDKILSLLAYLLSHPYPAPEDEKIETTKHKTKSSGDADYEVSDPFSIAINSVRGRAFQALVMFSDQDGKRFDKEDEVKISEDLKQLYESVLEKEGTRALMFVFGHYLPTFYFRDRDWIRGLLQQIFSPEPEKISLYTAAWEGYLCSNLYKEMFFDPEIQKLYERGLALTEADYPSRRHFKNPDKGIAEHLALAFLHYNKFSQGHPLSDAFWKGEAPAQHAEFVSFLGRAFVSGKNANAAKVLQSNPDCKKRLRDFWDWLLQEYQDLQPFTKLGSWMSLEKDIFEPSWLADRVKKTLKKTNGALDWDHELTKSIVRLAEAGAEDSLEIVRLYLLEGCVRRSAQRMPFYFDAEWVEAIRSLHQNAQTRARVEVLINELVHDGGRMFWSLKSIIVEES